MSRIGRKPIAVPAGVDVKIDGSTVTVKGPKGTLTQTFRPEIGIKFENSEILVTRPNDEKMEKKPARAYPDAHCEHGSRRDRGIQKRA